MIVHKAWRAYKPGNLRGTKPARFWKREGWFLFGLIPLYIRDLEYRNV